MATTRTRAHKRTRKPQPRHHTLKPVTPDAEFIGRLQAAVLISVNVQTIDLAINRAQLPAYRVGRRVLVKKADVLAWVEGNQK
jgi:excisionase family DNA binding protein